MPRLKLKDQVFGRLTAIEERGKDKHGRVMWRCRCECGAEFEVGGFRLKSGNATSCGCRGKEISSAVNTKHGEYGTPAYRTWISMNTRCRNENSPAYKNYGGRGIGVSEEWRDFSKFYADMGDRPEGASLDRIDNDLGYCKENCRWASKVEQANNRSSNVLWTYQERTQTVAEWSREVGIPGPVLRSRVKRMGWTVEEALTTAAHQTRGPTGEESLEDRARHAVSIALRTGRLTKPASCQQEGCENTVVGGHHHLGFEEENHLEVTWLCPKHLPKVNRIMVEFNGVEKSLSEWSESSGVATATLRARLEKQGWVATEGVFVPVGDVRGRLLTHQGITENMSGWAKRLGVALQTIVNRARRSDDVGVILRPTRWSASQKD